MTAYSPTTWINNTAPALNATNLNHLTDELEAQASAKSISHTLPNWTDGAAPALTDPTPLNEMERVAVAVAASVGLSYSATVWQAGWTPARNATRLNKLEAQVQANRSAIDGTQNPLPIAGQTNITTGGTYGNKHYVSSAAATIEIQTTQPVIIEDAIIEQTGTGMCARSVASIVGNDVTFRRCKFVGPPGPTTTFIGRAYQCESFHQVRIENCTIQNTGGIECKTAMAGALLYIGKNTCTNIQGSYPRALHPSDPVGLRQFVQLNHITTVASPIIEWNQVINSNGVSRCEDCISVFNLSSNAIIRDNYIQGLYPTNILDHYSANGILLGDGAGGSNNIALNNQIVGFAHGAVSCAGGTNQTIQGNRMISDGKTEAGQQVPSSFSAILLEGVAPANNIRVIGNYVGAMQNNNGTSGDPLTPGTLSRNDTYQASLAANNVETDNTWAYGNHSTPITAADEQAEWTLWQAKLSANSITIGAPAMT